MSCFYFTMCKLKENPDLLDVFSFGLLQYQEETIYMNIAVEKKKKGWTQLATLSFGKEQQRPYHPSVYGNTNYFI